MRGKWVCDQCDTLTQQAMPAYVIDKGIASPELLSHVLVSKYADHLPLYRQRLIYQRAGIELSRSTLSDWIGLLYRDWETDRKSTRLNSSH